MQTTQTNPTSPSKQPGSPAAPVPKSAPMPIGSDLFKHISGGTPTKGW